MRRAYRAAKGNVIDLKGFIDLFADDGVIHAGKKTYCGEELPYVVAFMGKLAPDVHRELHRIHVMGNVVAVELSIRGTFTGTFESPAGIIQGIGAKLDVSGVERIFGARTSPVTLPSWITSPTKQSMTCCGGPKR